MLYPPLCGIELKQLPPDTGGVIELDVDFFITAAICAPGARPRVAGGGAAVREGARMMRAVKRGPLTVGNGGPMAAAGARATCAEHLGGGRRARPRAVRSFFRRPLRFVWIIR